MRKTTIALAAALTLSACAPAQGTVHYSAPRPRPVQVLDKTVAVACVTTGFKYKVRTCHTTNVVKFLYSNGSKKDIVVTRAEASACQRREYYPCR